MQYSTVMKSNLECLAFRLDPEYYHPSYLQLYNKLLLKPHKKIDDIAFVTDGIHEAPRFDSSSPINLISAKAPKENYFDLSNSGKISVEHDKKNPRTRLNVNDVILSSTGTIGNCAVTNESILPANCDRDVGIIRIKDKKYKPRYLSTFLLCKYGRFQSIRESTGNVQLHLFIYKIKEIIVPELSCDYQNYIENICCKASAANIYSDELFKQAEQIILSELGLENWKQKHKLSFVKNFSDTQTNGRIDAEYLQPIYDEVVAHIKKYKVGWKSLGEIVKVKNKNIQLKDDLIYRYIELANISANGNINGFIKSLGKELPSRARRKVNTGDVIVSTIEGSLSSIALITKDLDNALCSTGFIVINSEKINSETLLVLLKSRVGQLQLKKGCSGTILTAISDPEFKKIILPDLPKNIQENIKKKITDMYEAKSLSKRLLDIAKRGVEVAIEKNEKGSQNWINAELVKVDVKL